MLGLLVLLLAPAPIRSAEPLFEERFDGKLDANWKWIRGDPRAWRLTGRSLEIRVEPGNMWGPENSGKNVLVRPLPPEAREKVEIALTVENRPTEQYEQVDLVWYYDDGHMVKIGQEMVDGRLSIVMGREEKDRTRTIAIIPLATARVELGLVVNGNRITGRFRPGSQAEWQVAGSCDLPANGEPRVAIQCYQGPKDQEHWAKILYFTVSK